MTTLQTGLGEQVYLDMLVKADERIDALEGKLEIAVAALSDIVELHDLAQYPKSAMYSRAQSALREIAVDDKNK